MECVVRENDYVWMVRFFCEGRERYLLGFWAGRRQDYFGEETIVFLERISGFSKVVVDHR